MTGNTYNNCNKFDMANDLLLLLLIDCEQFWQRRTRTEKRYRRNFKES